MRRILRVGATAAAALVLAACGTSAPHAAPTDRAPRSPTTRPTPTQSASASGPPAAPPHLRIRSASLRLPVAFGREAVISTGSSVLVAGGLLSGDSSTAAAYRIVPGHGQVTSLPSLPVPVHDTAGGLVGDEPLVIGGGNASEQSVVQGWDGHRWHVVGHLPQARSDLVAVSVGGRVVVLGGYNGSRPAEPAILSSADGRRWQHIGTLPVPVRYAAGTVARGAIWLFGGETDGTERRVIQRVDPTTGRARVVGMLPVGVGHAAAIPLEDRILIVGGRLSPDTLTGRMWWFDPATGGVRSAGRLPHPLADSAVADVAGVHYLVGGETPAMSDRVLAVTY